MGAAFFIVLDRTDPGFDTMANGKFLAQDTEQLEKIAKSLGMRHLEEYVSCSPEDARAMMEELGTSPEEIQEMELPAEEWFDSQEGLDLVGRVSAYIRLNPTSVKEPKGVLSDFEEYRTVLENAKRIGARWNLRVDF